MNIKRNFIIGDEWLYFKLYTGYNTADKIITDVLYPLTESLLMKHIIDQWFFIRYSDPDFHLRIRLHCKNIYKQLSIINALNKSLKYFLCNNYIWKIQIDTYQREIERYGYKTMLLSENLFFHDSRMIVKIINALKYYTDDELKGLFSLKLIDAFLDNFGFTLVEKIFILERLQNNFKMEFNIDKQLKHQFGDKYRLLKIKIEKILTNNATDDCQLNTCYQYIEEKSQNTKDIIKKIIDYVNFQGKDLFIERLIESYIHMMINRYFRSKQRVHELIIYDYLYRYYISLLARKN